MPSFAHPLTHSLTHLPARDRCVPVGLSACVVRRSVGRSVGRFLPSFLPSFLLPYLLTYFLPPCLPSILYPGTNPHTDLRSTGMLSLLQMLFFLDNHFEAADDILSLSQDTVYGFPFMIVGIRMTLLVIQVVRQGRLSFRMTEPASLFRVANELYCALFYKLVETWKKETCRIADFDRVLKVGGSEKIAQRTRAHTRHNARTHTHNLSKHRAHPTVNHGIPCTCAVSYTHLTLPTIYSV